MAKNVGDLLDELAMQHYVIVPTLSASDKTFDPVQTLFVTTLAKETSLKADIESFENKHRKEFKDLNPGNCKRQRVEAFNSDLMDLWKATRSPSRIPY